MGTSSFSTEDKEIGWDGNFKGKPLNARVFSYTFRADKSVFLRGNITLVKL